MAIGASAGMRYSSARNFDERVTYTLRVPEKRPRSGINALALGSRHLFAAGRDGVVRAWSIRDSSLDLQDSEPMDDPEASLSFDEHVDWVNDVLLVQNEERLVTASSDTTLKVWNVASCSKSLRTLMEHTDYVKALASLADSCVASGSLDGRILIWDLTTGTVRHEWGVENQNFLGTSMRSSIYCLASSQDGHGSVVVSGSTDRTISVFDCRTGENIVRLRGHADAVRSLALKHDATLLLSGSSDSTVRLWDLRQQRWIRTYDTHPSDSIWAIDANRKFDMFVAGGRDGTVWRSSVDGEYDSLAVAVADPVKRCNMVLDVCMLPDEKYVWVGTTGSTVRKWKLPSNDAQNQASVPRNDVDADLTDSGLEPASLSDSERLRRRYEEQDGLALEFKGLPAVVSYKVMNNRRHVMTCNTLNEVEVWDITRGKKIRSMGTLPDGQDMEQFAQEHDVMVSVPSWFQVDIRLGSLAIRLDRGSISNAEIYAVDADLPVESEDTKVNIGEHVLRALFASWKEKLPSSAVMNGQANSGHSPMQLDRNSSSLPPRSGPPARVTLFPPYEFARGIPVMITEECAVPILQRRTGSFAGEEDTNSLPAWVVDVVRDERTLARDVVAKVTFTLYPCEGCSLPELTAVNLNAPRVLRVRKVAAYVADQLNNAFSESGGQQVLEAKDLDIVCNGIPLDHKMNLATVRQFLWRSPDELQLHYKKAAKTEATTEEA